MIPFNPDKPATAVVLVPRTIELAVNKLGPFQPDEMGPGHKPKSLKLSPDHVAAGWVFVSLEQQ